MSKAPDIPFAASAEAPIAAPAHGMSFDINTWVAAAAANVPAEEVSAVHEMALKVARRFQTTQKLAMDTAFIKFARELNGRQILAFMAKFLELLEISKGRSYGKEDAQQILASTVSQESVAGDGSDAAATAPSAGEEDDRQLRQGLAASAAGQPNEDMQKAAVAQSADEKWEYTNMILYIEALQTLNTYVANENDIDYDTYEVEKALTESATLLKDPTMPTERQTTLREAAAKAKLKYEGDKRELQGLMRGRLRTATLHPAPPSVLKF